MRVLNMNQGKYNDLYLMMSGGTGKISLGRPMFQGVPAVLNFKLEYTKGKYMPLEEIEPDDWFEDDWHLSVTPQQAILMVSSINREKTKSDYNILYTGYWNSTLATRFGNVELWLNSADIKKLNTHGLFLACGKLSNSMVESFVYIPRTAYYSFQSSNRYYSGATGKEVSIATATKGRQSYKISQFER